MEACSSRTSSASTCTPRSELGLGLGLGLELGLGLGLGLGFGLGLGTSSTWVSPEADPCFHSTRRSGVPLDSRPRGLRQSKPPACRKHTLTQVGVFI
eukprot:scaffold75737_cov77-Phaeocystis_antarctica.AAC.2